MSNTKVFRNIETIEAQPMTNQEAFDKGILKAYPTIITDGHCINNNTWVANTEFYKTYSSKFGEVSDGYHTMNELYDFRKAYNALYCNQLAKQEDSYDVHKSYLHEDGSMFDGSFVVVIELPTGQVSNHYDVKDWDLFQVPEKPNANAYDGHTPEESLKRMSSFAGTVEQPVAKKAKAMKAEDK